LYQLTKGFDEKRCGNDIIRQRTGKKAADKSLKDRRSWGNSGEIRWPDCYIYETIAGNETITPKNHFNGFDKLIITRIKSKWLKPFDYLP